jgi:cell wall-associated NlpC family hydrolase
VHCRNTGRRAPRAHWARGVLVATILGILGVGTPGLAGLSAPIAGATGPVTSTTLPGPAPNQSQINATQAQVAQIESTLATEEQQASILDNRYDTAVQDLDNAQNALATIDASLTRTRTQVQVDKQHLANDAVKAYVYGIPQSKFASMFSTSASLGEARDQYTEQIVGDLDQARNALETSQRHLQTQETQQQGIENQAASEAAQAKSLAAANEQEAAATQATLSQVQGQLAQQVAQAAVEEAQAEAAAAAKAASAAQAQKEAEAAATAATVADAVGGSSSGAAATTAANQAASSAGTGSSGSTAYSGTISGTGDGTSQQMAAVQAAVSQLGVPYVFGGESPGVGFDCSGLVQWAWSQAGVSIPRTTETQWPSIPHVSLSALEPGDLLFYYNLDGDDEVDHVVMYTGSGPYGTDTVIQAPYTGSTVSYSPIFTEGLIGAGRP